MQPALPAEQEVYKSPVPPRRRFPKRCLQNESTFLISRPKSLQNESTVPRFSRSSDPANDHAAVRIGARRVAGRLINSLFVPQRFLSFALELDVVFFEMLAGLLLQILGPRFAEAEMLPRVFLRLFIISGITETIRQIRFLPRRAAVQRIKNLSPMLLL